MNKKDMCETLNKVTSVLCYIAGAALCITILGLPLGIPLIMAGSFYWKCSQMGVPELIENKSRFLGWSIFSGIVGFPCLTALVVITYLGIQELQEKGYANPQQADTSGADANSSESKLQRLEQLAEFRKKGLITEEEYNASKAKILAE